MEQKSGKKRKADHYDAQRNMTCVKVSVSKHRNDVSRIAF